MVDLLGWGVNRLEREAWDAVGSLTDVASRVMLSFGEFEFSIDTAAYNAMKRTMEWRWDEQQLIGKNDLLQYTGKGARTITLEGMVHAGFRDGVEWMPLIRWFRWWMTIRPRSYWSQVQAM